MIMLPEFKIVSITVIPRNIHIKKQSLASPVHDMLEMLHPLLAMQTSQLLTCALLTFFFIMQTIPKPHESIVPYQRQSLQFPKPKDAHPIIVVEKVVCGNPSPNFPFLAGDPGEKSGRGGYHRFKKCLKLPLHFTPRSGSSRICSTGLLTMYWRSSMGRRGVSPSGGKGNRFCATSIRESASDQTSEVTV